LLRVTIVGLGATALRPALAIPLWRVEGSLSASVWKQSPDGRLVVINGCYATEKGLGWSTNWGDGGPVTSEMFPALHRFEKPGNYQLTYTGYNCDCTTESVRFAVKVGESRSKAFGKLKLAETAVVLVPGETKRVKVLAFDDAGNELKLTGRRIEVLSVDDNLIKATVDKEEIVLAVNGDLGQRHQRNSIYVWVDKQECELPLNVIATSNEGAQRVVVGKRVALAAPSAFAETVTFDLKQAIARLDMAFDAMAKATGNRWPEIGKCLQCFVFDKPTYGSSGSLVHIGPQAFGSEPEFLSVAIHEMGHNFQAQSTFLMALANPGPFYQETLSEWFVRYVARETGLTALHERATKYHYDELENYIKRGKPFNYSDTQNGSHPLVALIYDLTDRTGKDQLPAFLKLFETQRLAGYDFGFKGREWPLKSQVRASLFLSALAVAYKSKNAVLRGAGELALGFDRDVFERAFSEFSR
jgi:hypothetical protein